MASALPYSAKIIKRFWARVNIKDPDECWEWQAGFNSAKPGYDYGCLYFERRSHLANRVSLSIKIGRRLKKEEHACHTCDNPRCCNPNHIFLGSHLANMRDMYAKGRNRPTRGEAHPGSKLTEEGVRRIRKLTKLREKYNKYTLKYFADRYEVDASLVKAVILRRAWKHVQD